MNLEFAKIRPPRWARFTAVLGALLMAVLLVASASPSVHAWLQGRDLHAAAATHANQTNAEQASTGQQDDDSCAVVLLSSGVLLAIILFALAGAFRRVVQLRFSFVDAVYCATPRYWLPPLCGPPLN